MTEYLVVYVSRTSRIIPLADTRGGAGEETVRGREIVGGRKRGGRERRRGVVVAYQKMLQEI